MDEPDDDDTVVDDEIVAEGATVDTGRPVAAGLGDGGLFNAGLDVERLRELPMGTSSGPGEGVRWLTLGACAVSRAADDERPGVTAVGAATVAPIVGMSVVEDAADGAAELAVGVEVPAAAAEAAVGECDGLVEDAVVRTLFMLGVFDPVGPSRAPRLDCFGTLEAYVASRLGPSSSSLSFWD